MGSKSRILNTMLSLKPLDLDTDLSDFYCGLDVMDRFIHNDLLCVLNQYNYAGYCLCLQDEIVAIFVIDTEKIEIIDKDTCEDINMFFDNALPIPQAPISTYPTLEILYLAVKEQYRKHEIGTTCINEILHIAKSISKIGIQLITVDAYNTPSYSAVHFYEKNHFIASEYINPNKDTLRMVRPLYIPSEETKSDCK